MARLDPLRRAIARSPTEIQTARPAYGWCSLMGGVLLWVVFSYGWCSLMGGVLLWVVFSYGWCSLMEGVLLWEAMHRHSGQGGQGRWQLSDWRE